MTEKEIQEQPQVISHTMSHYIDFADGSTKDLNLPFDFAKINRVAISACGTASYAGQIAKYWFERYARLPVDIDFASEFRYREMPLSPDDAALFISQSGETADTLAALRHAQSLGMTHTLPICNVATSAMVRECKLAYITRAGVEKSSLIALLLAWSWLVPG